MDPTAWSADLRITADGEGIVAWAGAMPVRMLADRTGLTGGLAQVLARRGFDPLHDRGRVLTDVAVAIACGARDIVDIEALRAQSEVFGPVASDTTARRALAETGGRARTAIARVRAAARAHVWALLPGGPPEATFAGGMCQPGMVVLRIDGSLVVAHSRKERAAPTFKKTYGHHPLGCWIDNTGELASLLLRAGNAGSNTADDLIAVLHEAIAQVPKPYRRRLLITSDGAGASHGLIDWCQRQNHAADRSVEYSVGFDVDVDVRAAIGRLPAGRWQPGLDTSTGGLRGDIDVAEVTDLLAERLERTGWPKTMRVIVRRTKLAPGRTAHPVPAGRLQVQLFRHQHRPRPVGSAARRPPPGACPGRGPGTHRQGHRPRAPALEVLDGQPRLVPRHHHRHRPARLAETARLPPHPHPGQGRTGHPALPAAARARPARAPRPHPVATPTPNLALGRRPDRRLRPHPRPAPSTTRLTPHQPPTRRPGGPRRPRPPARQPATRHTPTPPDIHHQRWTVPGQPTGSRP